MGKFSEKFISKISELRKIQAEPASSFVDDPRKGMDYFKRQVDADTMLNAVTAGLARVIRKLPNEPRIVFYAMNTAEERRLMTDANLSAGAEFTRSDPVFRRMVQNEGLDKLVEYAIRGGGRLTNAYSKAAEDLKPRNERTDPTQKTIEEKRELWKNKPLGPQQ